MLAEIALERENADAYHAVRILAFWPALGWRDTGRIITQLAR